MIRILTEEGHYTVKRVKKLPKVGNANWLYAYVGDVIREFYRWDAFKKEYETIKLGATSYLELTDRPLGGELIGRTSDIPVNDGADNTSTYVEFDELSLVATSNNYNDLINKPVIPVIPEIPVVPTNTSAFVNDGSDGTSTYIETDDLAIVATTNDYNDLTNLPIIPVYEAIPTNTSAFINDGADGTSTYAEFDELSLVATSNNYNDLINLPVITTIANTSELFNDGDDGTSPYVEADQLGLVATTNDYNDLTNLPTIPTVPTNTSAFVNDGSDSTSTYVEADELAIVATTNDYNDLTNLPTIPTVPTNTSAFVNDGSDGTSTYLEVDDAAIQNQIIENRIEFLEEASNLTTGFTGRAYAIWTGTGYEYNVIYPDYYIAGVRYPEGNQLITLTTPNVTFPRVDTIGVDAAGAISIQGIAEANPLVPTLDPTTQLLITSIILPAGSTIPTSSTFEQVYNENVEWTATSLGSAINFAATNNPSKGTVNGTVGATAAGMKMTFTNVGLKSIEDYTVFKFDLFLKANYGNNKTIRVRLFNGTTVVGTATISKAKDIFQPAVFGVYQTVVLDFSDFAFSGTQFDSIEVTFTYAASAGFDVDNVSIVKTEAALIPLSEQNTITTVITDNGVLSSDAPNNAINIIGANGVVVSSVDKTITITGITNTSELINNGSDGTSTYLEADDLVLPITIINTSSLASTGLVDTGLNTASAYDSLFLLSEAGKNATNAYNSNFIGFRAGIDATGARYSNFLGSRAGRNASSANDSNFLGQSAGDSATNAYNSNFLGYLAGSQSSNAYDSNFFGQATGYNSPEANNSNFFGKNTGRSSTDASYSTLMGFNVGNGQGIGGVGPNNIIIGTNISLPASTANSINLGGVLFGSGTYETITGTPSVVGQTSTGRIGINVPAPSTTLHVYSAAADTSGIRMERLTSASPTTTGEAIGVDASGNIVRVAAGATGVSSVSGTTVNNTDPLNPVIGIPTWEQTIIAGNRLTSVDQNSYLDFNRVADYIEIDWKDTTATKGMYVALGTGSSPYFEFFSEPTDDFSQFNVRTAGGVEMKAHAGAVSLFASSTYAVEGQKRNSSLYLDIDDALLRTSNPNNNNAAGLEMIGTAGTVSLYNTKSAARNRLQIAQPTSGGFTTTVLPALNVATTTKYIPLFFTNGTTTVEANSTGLVNISTLSGASGVQSVSGTAVDNTDPLNPIVNAEDLSGYVPYTGATGDVTLGLNQITLGRLVEIANTNRNENLLSSTQTGQPILLSQPFYWNQGAGQFYQDPSYGFGTGAIGANKAPGCIGIGTNTARYNTGGNSIGIGNFAIGNNIGTDTLAIGYNAANENKGARSVGLGHYAAQLNTGNDSVGVGHNAISRNKAINVNGLGTRALHYNLGEKSNGFGFESGTRNIAARATGFGDSTLNSNAGADNTALGFRAHDFRDNAAGIKSFNGTDANSGTYRVTIAAHGFGTTGTYVNLRFNQGTTALGSLTDNVVYQMKIVDANTLGFAELESGQYHGSPIYLDGQGTGHTLTPQFIYTNTTVLGSNAQPTKTNQVTLGDSNVTEVDTYGAIRSRAYGAGTKTGTPTYNIVVDANGNFIETALSGGAGVQSVTGTQVNNTDPLNPIIIDAVLEKLDEGNGPGYRIFGRDPAFFGNIGESAFDISDSTFSTNTSGATGEASFAQGYDTLASGSGAVALGYDGIANGAASVVMGNGGNENGYANLVAGAYNVVTDGAYATVIGQFANVVTNNIGDVNNGANTMFAVGNGTANGGGTLQSRSTAFQVYKSGSVEAPSLTTALITADTTGKILVTKEYLALQKIEVGTTYTILPGDLNHTIFFDSATAVTVTVNATLPANFECDFYNLGAGTVTFVSGTATIGTPDGANLATDKVASLIRVMATAIYKLKGDLV